MSNVGLMQGNMGRGVEVAFEVELVWDMRGNQ